MSGKGVSVPAKVSIPNGLKKTISNIKEATGQNHTDDEIYVMLKDCSMDPNETTQKLLLLDTFQEVKRKRDKKKEILNEAAESKLKPSIQARPNRAGRGNYPSRYISHNSGRNLVAARENVISHKGTKKPSLAFAQEIKKVGPSSSSAALPNDSGSSSNTSQHSNIRQDNHADSVLLPSQDLPLPNAVGSSQYEVGSDRAPVKMIADIPTDNKLPSSKNSSFEVVSSNLLLSLANDFHGVGNNEHLEPPLSASSTTGASIVSSRPSSNHDNRSQAGPHKVGPVKEWKPKATNSTGDGISTVTSSESVKSYPESQVILELQRKLEESQISSSEDVIIPNHLHVPQAEKLGFCFGSFDVASFGELSHNGVPASNKDHLLSQSAETENNNEVVEEQQLSHQNALVPADDTETIYLEQSEIQSPVKEPEFFPSVEVEILSSAAPNYDESKQEVVPGGTIQQHPVVHTSLSYNNGIIPPTPNGQRTFLESSESQARNAPRFPGYIVPQSFDPASYYAHIYRSGMDTDGRISPFLSTGTTASKHSDNGAVVSQQPIQSPQELQGAVPLVLSTSAPTPLAAQQPLPIFRHPSGVHLPHFSPNYIPYGPYLSPYYMPPPPTIHQYLSNGVFPQQPQAGNVYPTFTGTNAPKYPVSQYKQGSNMGNATHIGGPPGPYALSMANYAASNSAAITSTSSDDIAASQVKENNTYVNGQQIEGSGLWFSGNPNRDISTLPPTSFYNLPQGQLAFNPTQPGHGTFTGVFHHPAPGAAAPVHPFFQQSQAITSPADMTGPMASVYQHQQHPQQMNWPSNY